MSRDPEEPLVWKRLEPPGRAVEQQRDSGASGEAEAEEPEGAVRAPARPDTAPEARTVEPETEDDAPERGTGAATTALQRRLLDTGVLAALFGVLFVYFEPGLLLTATTTAGGDTAAHIYAPWYLKHHLLPKGLLAGWSPGWFAGFPMLHFYFPLVALLQAGLSWLMPYEIAFKIGTILGTFFFPVSVYLLLRLLRTPFPAPIAGAAVATGFLFMDSFTIYGGNIPSSLAGEYSFSFSIGLCLVFYGLAYRVATEEQGRPLLAAGVLALAVVTHLIPVIMVVLTAPLLVVMAWRRHGRRTALIRFGAIFGLAFALSAFWAVPFLARLGYTANMRWQSIGGLGNLFPRELWLVMVGALAGVAWAARRKDVRILLLLAPALWGVLLYLFLPEGHVWNGRFLPFWYIGVFLCCAYFVALFLQAVRDRAPANAARPLAMILAVLVTAASAGWILWDKKQTFIDEWISYNYEGYENKPGWDTFERLTSRLKELPPGRVMWEPSDQIGEFGSPVALMSLPYWSGNPSMEGMYFESSFTTPFHFLMAAEVAEKPSNPIPGLPYGTFDLQKGTDHMEMLDVSYYVTITSTARSAAMARPDLRLVADVDHLSIFEVESPGQVVVPRYEPVELREEDWVEGNIKWFTDPTAWEVPLVRGGDEDWVGISTTAEPVPRTPLEHGGAAYQAEVGDDSISFTTDAVGEPHWVKTSYFPNWKVEGAEGPYLASPTMMVVVPTQPEVRLTYQRTWAEWLGLLLSVSALAALSINPLRRRLLALIER